MKKFFAIAIALVIVTCSFVVYAEDSNLVTVEELLEKYDLSETEYLDDFITDYRITEEYMAFIDVAPLYNSYVYRREAEKQDFMYLLDATDKNHDGGLDADNITKVLWFWNPNSSVVVRLYDLQERILYFGDHNILNNISDAETKKLTEEDCTRVLKALEEYNVSEWEANYSSSENNTTGWLFWNLTLEYADGSLFQSLGSGSTADNLPKTYSQIKDALQEGI